LSASSTLKDNIGVSHVQEKRANVTGVCFRKFCGSLSSTDGNDIHRVMAGLVPVIPIGKARHLSNRDHRHEAGDDER
jgi:hypothetical protein